MFTFFKQQQLLDFIIIGVFPRFIKEAEPNLAYTLIMHNILPYPIDLYWVDVEGRKGKYVKFLGPGEKRQEQTYITHPWVFKQSNNGTRLYAFSHEMGSSVFEGENFGVIRNSQLLIHVIISTQGRLFILFVRF